MSVGEKLASPYLTQSEAAKYIKASLSYFKEEVRPAIPVCFHGRKPVFRAVDLDAYMTEHTHFTVKRARRGRGSGEAKFAGNAAAAKVMKELG